MNGYFGDAPITNSEIDFMIEFIRSYVLNRRSVADDNHKPYYDYFGGLDNIINIKLGRQLKGIDLGEWDYSYIAVVCKNIALRICLESGRHRAKSLKSEILMSKVKIKDLQHIDQTGD